MAYTTIVIKHDSDKRPISGFGLEVLGCEVTAIAMGDVIEKEWVQSDKFDDLLDAVREISCLPSHREDEIMTMAAEAIKDAEK